jgi:endonuclease IV
MENLLRYLVEQGIIDPNSIGDIVMIPFPGSGPPLPPSSVRVRQLIPYLLEDLIGVKNALPPKMFTEKYDTVKYPYSVTKKKSYSQLGLELEDLVMWKLFGIYKDKFTGLTVEVKDEGELIRCLSEKDRIQYLSQWGSAISDYFLAHYPANKIQKIVAGAELTYASDQTISGHPDLIIYLSSTKVVIFDVKVFAKMDNGKSRAIRCQMAMYIALARNQGLQCDRVGIIMPWARTPAVVEYDVSKWISTDILEPAMVCADKVMREPSHNAKWTDILRRYDVGSHLPQNYAYNLIKEGRVIKTPFQIFLYGNNPSAARERDGRVKLAEFASKYKTPLFGEYNAYVHAPYNLNLASEEGYVVDAAKMYLEDSATYGFRGVVFHTGHHPDTEKGIAIMKRNMTKILVSASSDTPFMLETPCGNKNELLATPEEFGEFIMGYPESLLGICMDLCHTWVSGYLPLEYIDRLGTASDRICLFHFNGSRKKQGCHADGHSHPTRIQNIPDEQLIGILDLAKEWNVDSVTE